MGTTYAKFIVGEVDYRVFINDKPFLYSTNLCLRYPSFYDIRPILM